VKDSANSREMQVRFGEAVRARRIALGLSQETLATRCGLHRTYISEIERGTKSPSLKTISSLSVELGVRPSELVAQAEGDAGA